MPRGRDLGPRAQSACEHTRQSTAGSNQYQGMIACLDCGKLMGQLYYRVDRHLIRSCPPFTTVVDAATSPLRHQLREMCSENQELEQRNRELNMELKEVRRDAKAKIQVCKEVYLELEQQAERLIEKVKNFEENKDRAWEKIPERHPERKNKQTAARSSATAMTAESSESEVEIPEIFKRGRPAASAHEP